LQLASPVNDAAQAGVQDRDQRPQGYQQERGRDRKLNGMGEGGEILGFHAGA
jgi:hypothetical protein